MLESLNRALKYRGLLYALTLRELQVRYKQSVLGIAWAILQPLALMLMFTLIFSTLLKVPSDGIPYPVFVYSALLPWTFFSGALSRAIPSLEENAALIRKIYFPRELFPISSVLAALVDFLIAAVFFLAMMFYFHIPFTLNMFFVIPILLIQIVFTLAIAFFASALNTYYRDVKHALPLLIMLWMYASPIIYSLSQVPERFQTYYLLNPMAGIMDSYRTVLVKELPPSPHYLGIAAGGSILLFILSYLYFKRIEMTFADVV
jgi:lipopolysaccharide transport system permease protein